MNKLSDNDIDEIIDLVDHSWENNKDFRGRYRKEYFISDLRCLLRNRSSGLRENVCIHCLGTGYKTNE